MTLPTLNFLAILPQLIVIAAALLVLIVDILIRNDEASSRVLALLTLLALLAAGAASLWLGTLPGAAPAFQNMALADGFALVVDVVVLTAAILGVLLAWNVIPEISKQAGSFYSLVLLAVSGMMTMGAAADLIVVFLALEILSLALYILVGFNRAEPRSAEASLKYFLLGAFASAFFLYGAALVYGATGTTNLAEIAAALSSGAGDPVLLYAGIALLIAGFGFKVALVPFHMWTPDVYQGAPTPVTAFMSVGAKAAGFAAFLRVFLAALPVAQETWGLALAALAVLTMTLGNLAALRQTSVKRMLAYSSIAHAGYVLVGVVPGTSQGVSSVLFYLMAYAFMNIGAFAVVSALERPGDNDVAQEHFNGLAGKRPALAAGMAIFMFSLAGVPPLAGFFGKFYLFSAAMAGGWGWLVVVGVINSVVSVFYYLRITVAMYFSGEDEQVKRRGKKDEEEIKPAVLPVWRSTSAVVFLAALFAVAIGLWSAPWTSWIGQAARTVFGG